MPLAVQKESIMLLSSEQDITYKAKMPLRWIASRLAKA